MAVGSGDCHRELAGALAQGGSGYGEEGGWWMLPDLPGCADGADTVQSCCCSVCTQAFAVGSGFPEYLAVAGGWGVEVAGENAGEVEDVLEAAFFGNILDWFVGVSQLHG